MSKNPVKFPKDRWSLQDYSRVVGNPSVTRPTSQRRVRCGLPVNQE